MCCQSINGDLTPFETVAFTHVGSSIPISYDFNLKTVPAPLSPLFANDIDAFHLTLIATAYHRLQCSARDICSSLQVVWSRFQVQNQRR